jgi:hypothetical protein
MSARDARERNTKDSKCAPQSQSNDEEQKDEDKKAMQDLDEEDGNKDEGDESDDDTTAVMVLKEYWNPPAGKGIKPQEVYSQRVYTVQVREGGKLRNVQLVAENQYESNMTKMYADTNPFYARVLASWRLKYPQPPIKGKHNR